MANTRTYITDHLDTWSSAIKTKASSGRGGGKKQEAYGIKRLRELILELAVRGLLVPQDSSDEPASELLRRISSERSALVRKDQIKRQKPLPPVTDYERNFIVPDSWLWIRLNDISGYIQRGKGPEYADYGSVRVVSQKCIQWTGLDLEAARFVRDESLRMYQPERYLRANDILWNSTGTGTVGRVLRIKHAPENALVADSHVTVVRVIGFDSSFVSRYLASPSVQNRIIPSHENSLVSGTTNQVELNTSSVIRLPVPLPPLVEQHRIVTKVDELMALCDQLELRQEGSVRTHGVLVQTLLGALTAASEREQFAEAWQQIASHFDTLFSTDSSIDQLKQTIMQLAVMGKLVEQDQEDEPAQKALFACGVNLKQWTPGSDPGRYETPVSWCWISFADAGSQRLGKMLDGAKNRGVSKPYLRNTNVQWMRIELDDLKEMRIEEREEDELRLQRGDLLICEGGEPGRCAIWRDEISEMYFQKALHRVRPHKCILPEYLALNLQVDCRNGVIETLFTGATIKHLTGRSLSAYSIPIPPFAEQCRIVAKVDELMTLCDRLKASLQAAQAAQAAQLNLADNLVETAIRLPALPDTVIKHNPCA